jgi:hypothetical protein
MYGLTVHPSTRHLVLSVETKESDEWLNLAYISL